MGIEVRDEGRFIRQAIRIADEALKVSQIVPVNLLTSWNDKLEYIITAYNSNPDDIEDLMDDLKVLKDEIQGVMDND